MLTKEQIEKWHAMVEEAIDAGYLDEDLANMVAEALGAAARSLHAEWLAGYLACRADAKAKCEELAGLNLCTEVGFYKADQARECAAAIASLDPDAKRPT